MKNAAERQEVVNWALKVGPWLSFTPSQYELALLDRYVQGELTIEEVIVFTEDSEREFEVSFSKRDVGC